MESAGEVFPILTTASRTERATLRAARGMARREAMSGRSAHLDLDDGLALTQLGLERLTACHRSPYRKIDWASLAQRPAVVLPVRSHERERTARHLLASYEPSWQDRMFADEAQRRRELTDKVMEAAHADEMAFQQAYRAAETHNAECLVARRLMQLEPKAIQEAVALKTQLAELRDAVNGVSATRTVAGRLVALVEAIQADDVPYERMAGEPPQRGRRELIPEAERRRIHLAAVCAAALRIGADLVCVLPVDAVDVVVECELEPAPGERPVLTPIAQLQMTARRLGELDWKDDAITLATSIGARLDWSLEGGFAPIRPVLRPVDEPPLAKAG